MLDKIFNICENLHKLNWWTMRWSGRMSDLDPMDKWQRRVDREIEKIQDAAKNHPGAGKPLNLNNDVNVPHDMRLSYKILAENDLAPDWIMTGKALEHKEAALQKAIQRAVQDFTKGRFTNAEAVWKSQLRKFRNDVDKHNSEVLSYNLKVPQGIKHRRMFDLDKVVALALEQR